MVTRYKIIGDAQENPNPIARPRPDSSLGLLASFPKLKTKVLGGAQLSLHQLFILSLDLSTVIIPLSGVGAILPFIHCH